VTITRLLRLDRARAGDGARASRAFLVAGAVAVSGMAVAPEPLRGWIFVAILVAATAAVAVAVRRAQSSSNPSWLLLVGAVVLVPAYVLWYPAKLQWDLELGSPSITDVLFLASYAAFIVGMMRLIRLRGGADRRVQVLDTLIISVGLGVLVWVAFISPSMRDDALSASAKLVAISYPLADVLLLGAVIRLLVQGGGSSIGDRLLAGWIAAQLAADLVYAVTTLRGTFHLANPATLLYAISFVLLGAALLRPSSMQPDARHDRQRRPGLRRLVLVGAATLVAPGVLVYLGIEGRSEDVATVALLSAVLFGLVLARMGLLMVDVRDHRRIQAQLTVSIAEERRRAEENVELLESLRERQALTNRLFRIQRKISTRAPLQEVLDSITSGAAELLGDDVAALRLLDEDDPEMMLMVSSVGVSPLMARSLHRLPITSGVGGRALTEDRLEIAETYTEWDGAIASFTDDGLRTAMGAPVHLEGKAVGSLVVASRRPGRRYTEAEKDALMSFAEHVSLAVNDAQTVQAMHGALDRAVHQAMHDDLTGLPNRACFYDRTDQALRAARRSGGHTAVLLFDLDRFKEINDTLGHRYGDRVLREIGPRISGALRASDTLARLGGDEFCVLLPDVVGTTEAISVAQRVVAALEDPFEIDGMTMAVEASCGIAVAPEHGASADLILQRADVAMYVGKRSHASVVVYEDVLDVNTPDRLALLGELRAAIVNNELGLHYQPKAIVATGVVTGVEALVRWQHPRLGFLTPDRFIPAAEDSGLIKPLTAWVLDTALRQLRQWMDAGIVPDDFSVAINLSARSLLDEGFRGEVEAALARWRVPARRLVLEVTETTIMADPARAHLILRDLASVGVWFAIDDFGTGYSSLAALKLLPVHHLKIDKSFVLNMHEDTNDATIVQSVIDLAHTLGLRTIAEGVETVETWNQLRDLGCDEAQGYLLARGLPPEEVPAWLLETSEARQRRQADWQLQESASPVS
jgi:diguanylate cyclase (GGDEF)-like protein